MTITLNQPETATTAPARSPEVLPRNTFPVGARFPRVTPEMELAYLESAVTTPATKVVYPVGARFPRRDSVTVVAMVDGKEYSQILPPVAPRVRSEFPVGARFPRRNG